MVRCAALLAGDAFLMRCGLLDRHYQGEVYGVCVPDGGNLRRSIIRECHETPLFGHLGRQKTAAQVRRLAYWPGQTRNIAAYARSCDTYRRTKVEHVGPHGLLHPLPLPTRWDGTIGLDWLMGLPLMAQGFNQWSIPEVVRD